MTTEHSPLTRQHTGHRLGLRAAYGMIAAGIALGVGELLAAVVDPASSPYLSVGNAIIDHVPSGPREFAIDTFGTSDKNVLLITMAVVITIAAAIAGVLERKRAPVGSALFAAAGVFGIICATSRPGAHWDAAVPTLLGVLCGIAFLRLPFTHLPPAPGELAAETPTAETPGHAPTQDHTQTTPTDPATGGSTSHTPPSLRSPSDHPTPAARTTIASADRRSVLRAMGFGAIVAAVSGFGGRALSRSRTDLGADRSQFTVPRATNSLAPVPDTAQPGISPYITPNADFYRIDTALEPPRLRSTDWSLRIHGMVDREIRIDLADLQRMPAIDKLVTLTCVSNEVGGDLIGNARWTGYRLADLLAMAHPHADADMVLSRSSDGFTAGTPLTAMTDGRESLLAVAMNGQPLPVEHGYPARLVVPGLYGYVSATKWVVELEVTRFDRATSYWVDRGWAEKGPIKMSSRIDTPRSGSSIRPGMVTVGGVAWAQQHGIDRVQVRVDDGPWNDAVVELPDDIDTWRLWRWNWQATSGSHALSVRAFDHNGVAQSTLTASPIPDGASGLHRISVTVR